MGPTVCLLGPAAAGKSSLAAEIVRCEPRWQHLSIDDFGGDWPRMVQWIATDPQGKVAESVAFPQAYRRAVATVRGVVVCVVCAEELRQQRLEKRAQQGNPSRFRGPPLYDDRPHAHYVVPGYLPVEPVVVDNLITDAKRGVMPQSMARLLGVVGRPPNSR